MARATESARKSLPHHYAMASCLQPATYSHCGHIIYTQARGDRKNRRPTKRAQLKKKMKTTKATSKNGVTRQNSVHVNASNPYYFAGVKWDLAWAWPICMYWAYWILCSFLFTTIRLVGLLTDFRWRLSDLCFLRRINHFRPPWKES